MLRFKARRKSPAGKPQGELTASERRVIRLMDSAMESLRREVDRLGARLVDAVAHKSIDQIVNMIPVDPWLETQKSLQDELLGELLDAGSRVSLPPIQKAVLTYSFDRGRPEAAAWASGEAGFMIREVVDGQREMVRGVVANAQSAGVAPADVARQIRGGIGLTTAQAGWVNNRYEREYARYVADGMSPTVAASRAQAAADRYQQQVHRYRSMTIARTEIMRANTAGRGQAWAQGMAGGWISPNALKEWNAEGDACQICIPLNGMRVPIKSQFPLGEPPAHPNCRCDVLLVDEVPKDIQQMTDAELDAELERLLGGGEQSAPITTNQQLADTLNSRGYNADDVMARFDNAKTGKQSYIDDYQRQTDDWESLYDGGYGDTDPYDAAVAWGSDDYRTVNATLVDEGSLGQELRQSAMSVGDFLDKMDQTFSYAPGLTDDVVVRRATSSQYPSIRDLTTAEPGALFQTRQYTATTMQSLDEMRIGGIGGDVEMEILLPRGSNVLNVDAVTYSGTREYEMLINRDATFVVLDTPTKTEGGRWLIRLLLIG